MAMLIPQTSVNVFWGEIAPAEHFVQLYESESAFIDSLEGYVSGGLKGGETVVIIATPAHVTALDKRLADSGFDLPLARARDRYITLDAEITLAQFMVNDWPDEALFQQEVAAILTRARKNGRRVRAFGEMVAILWAQGHCGATVQLERLWETLCHAEGLPLFCAYPKSGFTADSHESLAHICAAHSKIVA